MCTVRYKNTYMNTNVHVQSHRSKHEPTRSCIAGVQTSATPKQRKKTRESKSEAEAKTQSVPTLEAACSKVSAFPLGFCVIELLFSPFLLTPHISLSVSRYRWSLLFPPHAPFLCLPAATTGSQCAARLPPQIQDSAVANALPLTHRRVDATHDAGTG